ncbi:MAG: iron-sulfur cluster assembly scaffold protein [Proteobacteria bacterium]|nr:iron-sulfur cluster assembly scaffold protein [Desulfobacula sp.]MBU3954707.1 iron-sulfur cluster assembly scaffold protein [Pseudomonadota bacterium]
MNDFWNKHSLQYLEMAFETGNRERIQNPDGTGKRTGDCGDTIAFFIMVEKGLLSQVSFEVQGCLNTVACSNTLVRLARGLSVEKAWDISPDHVASFLQTLPDDHYHCAELAVGAFYLALSDYQNKKKDQIPGAVGIEKNGKL